MKLKELIRYILCGFGAHEWKRAKRTFGNSGTQECKHCAKVRAVTLRARAKTQTLETTNA